MACNFNCTQLFSLHLKGSIVTSNVLTLIHRQINNEMFFTACVWFHSIWHKKSHVFTESYTEQHFVTLVSSISFFLAVTWAVCVCMDRCVRCWQLLISDCKVLIMRAADLFLKSTTSKTLLEGKIKCIKLHFLPKIIFEYHTYMITVSVGELVQMYTWSKAFI